MAIFGAIETVKAQCPRTPAMTTAWNYIAELLRPGSAIQQRLLGQTPGASEKHELADGVFAIEQTYETKPRAEGFFEAHRRMIDIQVVVAGDEIMEVVDLLRAKEKDPYQESRDLTVFADTAEGSRLRFAAGEAAVFFPNDVHMPGLRVGGGPVLVRKSVLKVPVNG